MGRCLTLCERTCSMSESNKVLGWLGLAVTVVAVAAVSVAVTEYCSEDAVDPLLEIVFEV